MIVVSNGKYLSNDGFFYEEVGKKSFFIIEFYEGELVFRIDKGIYFMVVGIGKI